MSNLPFPIAILMADVHLSHTAPAARSHEPDWYEAMRRQLVWLRELQSKLNIPILIAGDIFHKYNPPVELVNFALQELPNRITAIPGQHDLPFHNMDDIHKSAYWTLVEAHKIRTSVYQKPEFLAPQTGVVLHGFPFGCPLKPYKKVPCEYMNIAMIHEYCWQGKSGFPGASEDKTVNAHRNNADGYDILIFGDNHIPHEDISKNPIVFNCGGFYRRTIDEINHKPSVGILYSDKTIRREYVPVDEDIFVSAQEKPVLDQNISEFVKYLANTTTNPLDVEEVIRNYVITHNVPESVQVEISRLLTLAK
jgi:DNA repair exonuclease SbcCD nuclease subunit